MKTQTAQMLLFAAVLVSGISSTFVTAKPAQAQRVDVQLNLGDGHKPNFDRWGQHEDWEYSNNKRHRRYWNYTKREWRSRGLFKVTYRCFRPYRSHKNECKEIYKTLIQRNPRDQYNQNVWYPLRPNNSPYPGHSDWDRH
jgi:hypothetical protein